MRGFPQPEVNWTRDGKLLNTTNKLTIKQVTYGDAGQYTCSAKNSKGRREAAFQVTVTGKCLFYFFSSGYSFHFLFFFFFSLISPFLNYFPFQK